MTHDFQRDKKIVDSLIKVPLFYFGILGSKNRTERLIGGEIPNWIHSPVGLSIGADGPTEIAVSIIAEMISMKSGGVTSESGRNLFSGRKKSAHGYPNKLALPVGKMSLGSLALDTALNSTLSKVFIIVRNEDDASWIAPDMLTNPKAVIVKCPTAHLGQAESLRSGIEKAKNEKADAAMVILADQPFITVLMLDEIINCMKSNPTCNYVATTQ